MRLVCTLHDPNKGRQLSAFLKSEGIGNQMDLVQDSDWGSSGYGDSTCRIWVYEEDQFEDALKWAKTFEEQPSNPIFKKYIPAPAPLPLLPSSLKATSPTTPKEAKINTPPNKSVNLFKRGITTFFLGLCCLLFALDWMTTPVVQSIPKTLPATPLISSPLKKALLYDYPKAFESIDKLVKIYGLSGVQYPQELPAEGQFLLDQFHHIPYWQGGYDLAVEELQNTKTDPITLPPLFEKIRAGEIWRLFTPAVLHYDILHLLFNMIWLIVLGKQMEERLSSFSYLLFIIITAVFSNTCQYLMTGSNFEGFSGVVCAMLTFIWVRQKVAPWEGYPLEKGTFTFLMFFIITMFWIQLASFYLETSHWLSISPGIANTAHLSGAILGALLGRLSFFSLTPSQRDHRK